MAKYYGNSKSLCRSIFNTAGSFGLCVHPKLRGFEAPQGAAKFKTICRMAKQSGAKKNRGKMGKCKNIGGKMGKKMENGPRPEVTEKRPLKWKN